MEINSCKIVNISVIEVETSKGRFRVDEYGTVMLYAVNKGWQPPYGFDYEEIHAVQIMALDLFHGVH